MTIKFDDLGPLVKDNHNACNKQDDPGRAKPVDNLTHIFLHDYESGPIVTQERINGESAQLCYTRPRQYQGIKESGVKHGA